MEYVFLFIRLYRFAEYHRLAVLAVEERYVAVRQLISQISAAAKKFISRAAGCGSLRHRDVGSIPEQSDFCLI